VCRSACFSSIEDSKRVAFEFGLGMIQVLPCSERELGLNERREDWRGDLRTNNPPPMFSDP
jgi:hypothetical protein